MSNLLASLIKLCENLKIEIENLKAENKAFRIENAELKERLGLNAKNSSIPSSKELYKITKDKPKKATEILEPKSDMKVISELKWMQMKW